MIKLSDKSVKKWIKQAERDVLALGSVVFYFLVIGRALVGPFWDLFTPLIIVAVILVTVNQFYKDIDLYLTRAMVVGSMTTQHYSDVIFGLFALVLLAVMVFASYNQGNSRPKIIRGLMLGLVLSTIFYPLAMSLKAPALAVL